MKIIVGEAWLLRSTLKGTNPRSIQRYTITDCVQLALENKCALSYQIIEHPSLAGIKYRPTRACVISNTRNRNVILKELEQQKNIGVDVPSSPSL